MPSNSRTAASRSSWTEAAVDALLASSRALVAVSARSIASNAEVTLPQFRMLVVLSQSPTNLTGLAGALDVAPSTALRMVDRLIDAGLVERQVPPENRRETRLSLTPAGQVVVDDVTARRRRDLEAIVATIPEAELDRLVRAMTLFSSAADELWPVSPAKPTRWKSSEVREWARSQGIEVSERGRIPNAVIDRFEASL
jgi:DNA-binding MarR family transcriptional regulator